MKRVRPDEEKYVKSIEYAIHNIVDLMWAHPNAVFACGYTWYNDMF